MNVYVQFALAMCIISLIALVATGYLAASFNRRAKADLGNALAPLAELVDGEVDLENAEVRGTYVGHLVFGRMANAGEGPGRVFQVDLIDAAGGPSWRLTSDPARRPGDPPRLRLETDDSSLEQTLTPPWSEMAKRVVNPASDRYRLEYDAAVGRLRFSRPMRTRRDIPSRDAFAAQLQLLVALGPINRRALGAPDADWEGGRRADDGRVGEQREPYEPAPEAG